MGDFQINPLEQIEGENIGLMGHEDHRDVQGSQEVADLRREISAETSSRVIICPEPVGHSTLNSSP